MLELHGIDDYAIKDYVFDFDSVEDILSVLFSIESVATTAATTTTVPPTTTAPITTMPGATTELTLTAATTSEFVSYCYDAFADNTISQPLWRQRQPRRRRRACRRRRCRLLRRRLLVRLIATIKACVWRLMCANAKLHSCRIRR